MRQQILKTYRENPRVLIRKAGYGELRTRKGPSYTRRFGPGQFPRFHVYLDIKDIGFQLNMHLDQKATCYKGLNMHSGEYGSEAVEKEMKRVTSFFDTYHIT